MQISEGVIHLGLRPLWVTFSLICRILHILRKPNSIIANYFVFYSFSVVCISLFRRYFLDSTLPVNFNLQFYTQLMLDLLIMIFSLHIRTFVDKRVKIIKERSKDSLKELSEQTELWEKMRSRLKVICVFFFQCSKTCAGGLMIRKLKCIRTDELGHIVPAARELCRYALKPLTVTETVCNDDIPCDRKKMIPNMLFACLSRKDIKVAPIVRGKDAVNSR